MKTRLVLSVSVCTALLAASAAVPGTYAANITPRQAISYSNSAYSALVRGNPEKAVVDYTAAIESRKLPAGQLANALLNRALANQKIKRYKDAVTDYTAALRIDALSARMRAVALYNRGLAQQGLKRPAAAIEDFTSALFLDHGFAQAYYSRANVLRENGQYLFAIADYRKSASFGHPQRHLPVFGEALTYGKLRQTEREKALLLKALAMKPDFKPARVELANLGVAVPDGAPHTRTARLTIDNYDTIPDTLVTGSIAPASPDLVVRKKLPPKPVPVPKRTVMKVSPKPAVLKMPELPAPPKVASVAKPAPAKQAAAKPEKQSRPVAETKTAVKAAPVMSKTSGWSVQLSSQRSSEQAWNVWNKLAKRYSRLLTRQSPAVVKAEIEGRGIFYRLRVHKIGSRTKAARLCSSLKRRGTSCFVTRS